MKTILIVLCLVLISGCGFYKKSKMLEFTYNDGKISKIEDPFGDIYIGACVRDLEEKKFKSRGYGVVRGYGYDGCLDRGCSYVNVEFRNYKIGYYPWELKVVNFKNCLIK